MVSFLSMIPFFCLLVDKRNQKKPDAQLQCKTIQFNGSSCQQQLATYDGNLLAFNEIFCTIKGALCRELWAPYFSSSEVRSPAISQASNSKNQRAATASRCLLLCAVVDTIQKNLSKLGMKPRMQLQEIIIFSLSSQNEFMKSQIFQITNSKI